MDGIYKNYSGFRNTSFAYIHWSAPMAFGCMELLISERIMLIILLTREVDELSMIR